MRQDLVGYLLGALDGPEQDEIRNELLIDDSLREAMSNLEERLAPFEALRWEYEPPAHLAAMTCATVARACLHGPRVFSPVAEQEGPRQRSGRTWRWVDMAVAAAVLVIFSGVLSPAVLFTRQQARIAACSDHLRGLGMALPSWAERVSGWLPHIPAAGNAGVAGFYAPQLKEAGLLADDAQLICPDSPQAGSRHTFRIPTVRQVFLARGAQLTEFQRYMGGSYNYNLGYVVNGRHAARRFTGSATAAVLGDRYSPSKRTGPHGPDGLNILFEDGHVRFVQLPQGGASAMARGGPYSFDPRELYVSDRGFVEAGSTAHDIVLASSSARPFPRHMEHILLAEPAPTVFDFLQQTMDGRALDPGSVLHALPSDSVMPWWCN